MNDDIRQLTELQVVDLQIAELDAEKETEQSEIERRRKVLEERQESIAELQERIEAAAARHRELESEHTDELSRIKERQSKMMQVQTNREYQSLLKEIEDSKRQNKEREDEMVELLEKQESLQKILVEQQQLAETEEKSLAADAKKVDQHTADLEKQKTQIARQRENLASKVKGSILKKYDMLRTRRNGKAVVGVANSVCQGCFMSVPPQLYNDIMKGDRMLSCPACQRILYHSRETAENEA